MREQFEKLPEIAKILQSEHWYFIDDDYLIYYDNKLCLYVQGAWYAFQEQQKKLQSVYDDCTEYTTVSDLLDSIKDILK